MNPPQSVSAQDIQSEAGLRAIPEATLAVELIRGLDARKVKPGDIVVAKCTQDLELPGQLVIPKNSKLIGHVAEVQTKGRGNSKSTLGIAFDKAIMRDGREIPLGASIQALAPPLMTVNDVGETDFDIRNASPSRPRTSGLLPGGPKNLSSGSNTHVPPALNANTNGVVGLKGLQLDRASSSTGKVSVIHSSSKNVRLESGTRLILRVSFQ